MVFVFISRSGQQSDIKFSRMLVSLWRDKASALGWNTRCPYIRAILNYRQPSHIRILMRCSRRFECRRRNIEGTSTTHIYVCRLFADLAMWTGPIHLVYTIRDELTGHSHMNALCKYSTNAKIVLIKVLQVTRVSSCRK